MSFASGTSPQRHVLERSHRPPADRPSDLRLVALPSGSFTPPAERRDRLWELSPNLHCSIIGTCLTTADLRSLMAKLGLPRAASEHDLHAQAVSRAARKDDGGKLLHKLLDRRHAREVQHFAKADDAAALRTLWKAALEKGEIPGAYWAVLTHPRTDRDLVRELFGEVHMLSHLLGRSVRADLGRLADLEAETAAQADLITELSARVAALTDDKVDLTRRLEERSRASPPKVEPVDASEVTERLEGQLARLTEQLGRAEAHAQAEQTRREEAERALRALVEDVKAGSVREVALRGEVAALEEMLAEDPPEPGSRPQTALTGLTLLYVGGRPGQVARTRQLVARAGGRLLAHDGGIEDSPALLPGLVGQADAAFFPVDCVSHDAVGTLKRLGRERHVPILPLRSASLAAFVSAIRILPQHNSKIKTQNEILNTSNSL